MVGEGLKPPKLSADERQELLVDSEDLPDDDEYESDHDENENNLAEDSAAVLIEDSQAMDEAVINILDDPMALSMTLKKQFDDVQNKN